MASAPLNATEQALYAERFKAGINLLPQNMKSKLLPFAQMEQLKGAETIYIDYVAALDETTDVKQKTSRYGDTEWTGITWTKQALFGYQYDMIIPVDNMDVVRSLNNPTNKVTQSMGAAFERHKDRLILDSLLGDSFSVTGNKVALAASAFGGTTVAEANTGLTIDKLLQTASAFDDAEVPEGQRIFVGTTNQRDDLLALEKVTSSDYALIKALVNGDVDTFMGFKFVWFSGTKTYLAVDGSDIRDCIAFAAGAFAFGQNDSPRVIVSNRPDKNDIMQVAHHEDIGAVRLVDDLVVKVECDETPD